MSSKRGEFGGPLKEKYSQMVAEEIVPFVDEHYRTLASPESRLNLGMGFASVPAIHSTFEHSEVFGNLACQSIYTFTPKFDFIWSAVKNSEARPKVYIEWGKYDWRSPLVPSLILLSNCRESRVPR